MHNYESKRTSPHLWSGRFREAPADALRAFTFDDADRRLLRHDVLGSIGHAKMLAETGLVETLEAARLQRGLAAILAEAEAGTFAFLEGDEDVHSAVERRLGEIEGPAIAGKLHTGRSRNDQVATDLKLYLRDAAIELRDAIFQLIAAIADAAEKHRATLVPAYTHLQQAQAVPFSHVLLAYAWMASRDADRLAAVGERLSESPLGAGACGGTSLAIDPAKTAAHLGFATVFANSIDAAASRDFAAEFAFACAQGMVHLSRLAEDLTLWNSKEFAWIRLPDALATGSSMLPQKKNPDIAELARGKAAGAIGQVTALLVLQKGLPLAYNRDLQEDKKSLFAAIDAYRATLQALAAVIAGFELREPRLDPSVLAIDLAERLVARQVPFREAHRLVGQVVRSCEERGVALDRADLALLHAVDARFAADDLAALDPRASVAARRSPGGGSNDSVTAQIASLRSRLEKERNR